MQLLFSVISNAFEVWGMRRVCGCKDQFFDKLLKKTQRHNVPVMSSFCLDCLQDITLLSPLLMTSPRILILKLSLWEGSLLRMACVTICCLLLVSQYPVGITPRNGKRPSPNSALYLTLAEDRFPPSIVANTGLVLDENSAKKITTLQLSATDRDSEPTQLQYKLTKQPQLGHLEHVASPGQQDDILRGWVILTAKRCRPLES